MKSRSKYFILFVLLLAAVPARGQIWLGKSEIGFTVGGMNYIGDLNNQSMLTGTTSTSGGLFASMSTTATWRAEIPTT